MADIGVIGLAVMGKNIVLNMADKGFSVCVYNRTTSKVDAFLNNEAKGKSIEGAHSLEEFFSKLKSPKIILLMVKAGKAVDDFIEKSLPYLKENDIVIDGGNSYFLDTIRRYDFLEDKKIHFIGMGISGGEKGAREGASIMPGGNKVSWPYIKDIFQKISAKKDNIPCCEWMGNVAAGHYVKMIHNGIEYVDMQLIAEAFDILHVGLGLPLEEISNVFDSWNNSELKSYLLEITKKILIKKDDDNSFLLEKISDSAKQKGTGKWSSLNALEENIPSNMMAEAVFSRIISSYKDLRKKTSSVLKGPAIRNVKDKEKFISKLKNAFYAARVISFSQGLFQIKKISEKYNWEIDIASVVKIWRAGCIIQSSMLDDILYAYENDSRLTMLILDKIFLKNINSKHKDLRYIVSETVKKGISTLCFSSCISYYDAIRRKSLPTNLIQAQRDFFGSHGYERIDKENESFHTIWE